MGTALVTGGTSGLGREFCWQLAAAKHNLVIVARDFDRLEELAEEIHQLAGVHVETIQADLAEPSELAQVCIRLSQGKDEGKRPIGLLVNNAGFGLGSSFLDNEFDRELYGLDVMVRAVMALSYYAGNAMRERGRGAILNVSSVAADTGMGTYSAHKAWVRSFSEGLAEELADTGVSVTAIMPGLVRTEFHERSGMHTESIPDFVWGSPEQVVDQSLAAVRRGDVLFTPTVAYQVVSAAARLVPRRLVRAITRRIPHT